MNAARVGDATTHGAPLAPGLGSTNVFIGGQPAWRAMIDQHACPATSVSGSDGIGSVLKGSMTVLINNQMACRMGDQVIEKPGAALGPVNPILAGCPTVTIGEKGPPAPGGFGSSKMINASLKAAQEPIKPSTPQGNAMNEAAEEGVPLVEKCPYVQHA